MLEGTIIRDTDEFIKIKVENGSEIKIDRAGIQFIKKASQEALQKTREFEEEQQQKGLVNYEGQWIPPDEREKASARDALSEEIRELRLMKEKILTEISELQGKRTYQNEEFQFSFNPPDNWVQMPPGNREAVCFFQSPQDDDFKEYISVSVASKTTSAIDQDFIDASITGLEDSKEGYLHKIRGFDVIKVDGLNALKITMSRYFFKEAASPDQEQEPYHQKLLVYFVIGATRIYKIECSALFKDFDDYEDTFDTCIKSFLIKDREDEPEPVVTPATAEERVIPVPGEPAEQPVPQASPIFEAVTQYSVEAEEFGTDKVFMKNDRKLVGTIMQETNDSIRLRVESPSTPEYELTIPRENIESIQWMPEEERRRKLQYEEEQRQKGLVRFYGHWIPIEQRNRFYRQADQAQEEFIRMTEADALQQEAMTEEERQRAEQMRQEQEIAQLLTRIKELEDENAVLREELQKQRDITNEKLDEFLERERQQIPIGKVAQKSKESVVQVLVKSRYAYSSLYDKAAAGAIVDDEGFIISNYYIGENPFREEWSVELPGGERVDARIVEYDSILDVAIIKIDALGLSPLPIGNPEKLKVGDEIIHVGAPIGYSDSMTAGRVLGLESDLIDLIKVNLSLRRNIERKYAVPDTDRLVRAFESDYGTITMIQHNAITYASNNGGPLLDKNGALIGVNQNLRVEGTVKVVAAPSVQSFNMAVSINSVKRQRKFSRYLH